MAPRAQAIIPAANSCLSTGCCRSELNPPKFALKNQPDTFSACDNRAKGVEKPRPDWVVDREYENVTEHVEVGDTVRA
jgi:hypothetical protein